MLVTDYSQILFLAYDMGPSTGRGSPGIIYPPTSLIDDAVSL